LKKKACDEFIDSILWVVDDLFWFGHRQCQWDNVSVLLVSKKTKVIEQQKTMPGKWNCKLFCLQLQ
jgi:hypothetical protein